MQSRRTQPAGMRGFLLVWVGQLVSLLGTGMTGFALSIWAWQLTGQATVLALVSFFSATPVILFSPFAGVLIDRWNRKLMMMISDITAFVATGILLLLYTGGHLQIWHLYAAAAFIGLFQAFQWPAYSAAITTMLPKEQYGQANGMMGLANSIASIGSPILAGLLIVTIGIGGIMTIDVITYGIAIVTLLVVFIPQPRQIRDAGKPSANLLKESVFGFRYIFDRPSLLGLQLVFLAFNLTMNFAFTLAVPMILARSGNNRTALSTVEACFGLGGVIGGILMSVWGGPKRKVHGIFIPIIVGSLFIMLFSMGQSLPVWIAGSLCIAFVFPFVDASNQAIWQAKVEPALQGRVFATRRLIAQASVPLIMLISGPLADKVFEPAMMAGGSLVPIFGGLVGSGVGAGMALMFVISGCLGVLVGLGAFAFRTVRDVETLIPDQPADPSVDEPGEPAAQSQQPVETSA